MLFVVCLCIMSNVSLACDEYPIPYMYPNWWDWWSYDQDVYEEYDERVVTDSDSYAYFYSYTPGKYLILTAAETEQQSLR